MALKIGNWALVIGIGVLAERFVFPGSAHCGVAGYRYEFKISQLLWARLSVSFVTSSEKLIHTPESATPDCAIDVCRFPALPLDLQGVLYRAVSHLKKGSN
ncbi:hypothetical protein QUA79_06490 [Microcoleus sp. F8-D1]